MVSECGICGLAPESIDHLFAKCNKSNQLWENVAHWIKCKIGLQLNLSDSAKILGYLPMDGNFWPIKFILMVTRKYIYWSSKKGYVINIFHLQKEIKRVYLEQKLFFQLKSQNNKFVKIWGKYIYRNR